MKRILLVLLFAIALPTAINAETFYLKCTITKGRKNPENIFINFKNPIVDNHQFTLNEENQSAVYYTVNNGISRKIDNINFNQESISMKYIKGSGYSKGVENISINRLTGKIVQIFALPTQSLRLEGKCRKSEPKQTLF